MSASSTTALLRLLSAMLLTIPGPALAGTHAAPQSPPSATREEVPAGEDERDADERESPPQRATLDQLETVAAGAVAPQRGKMGLAGIMGLGPAGLDWTFLGPQPMTGEYWSSNSNVGGRVSCVAPHPTDPNVAYLAAAQGGVWKTVDGGATWTVLTDALSSIASGWLAIDALNPNTVWYGTGEAHYSADSFYGDGLFKSTDAGATWTKVATTAQVGNYIARVALRPGSSDTIFVGGNRGFVRSTDSGLTWTQTLAAGWCDDIVVDPVTPTHLCCAVNGVGVFRSTDTGVTWTKTLTTPGRTNLGMSPSNPTVVYASAATAPGYLSGAYRSSDGGGTWATLTGTPEYLYGQGWYDNTVAVSPTDSATVFVGGVYPYNTSSHGVLRSTTAGTSWTDVTIGADAKAVHPDQHCLAFGPGGTLWLGNDGGVWKSTDLGGHWTDCNATLAVAQFYTVATHPTSPNDIIGGTQDNGTVRFTGSQAWPVLVSGDGGSVVYQHESPSTFYTSYVKLNPLYKFTNGSYVSTINGGWGGLDRADWANGPLLEDPTNNGVFYLGTYRVWESLSFGGLWGWISGDLTNGGVLKAIAIASSNNKVFWTGASDGALRRTRNGGTTWTQGATQSGSINNIVLSAADTATAYICVDVSSGARVAHTTDGGSTFTTASGNLPAGLRGLSLVVDWRTSPERLYLGTDYGVYASLDGGTNWTKASNNMPSVSVPSMALDVVNSKLVAATHGRGMWRADLDVTGPALALTSPVGGESWPLAGSRTITWTATDPSGVASVDLALSLDGGATYPTVIASGLPNSGSYGWTVAPGVTDSARVKVIARDGLGQASMAVSAANFSIISVAGVEAGGAAFAFAPVSPSVGAGPFGVRFALPSAGRVSVDVYDASGRRTGTLANGTFGPGLHSLTWNGHDQSGAAATPGVYFVRLRAAGHDAVRRIAIVR